jgi:signal transduction histidine kinase
VYVRPAGIYTQVEVNDDGKGFDTSKKSKGIGIANMMNRVESFNGEVRIESTPGKGSRVQVMLPY